MTRGHKPRSPCIRWAMSRGMTKWCLNYYETINNWRALHNCIKPTILSFPRRDCVAILICYCETPLRRCGNLNRTRGCNPLFNKESMGLLRSLYSLAKTLRHSLEDRNPILLSVSWIPAFAGMTNRGVLQRSQLIHQRRKS